jgi:hypothetical protein
VLTIVVNAVIAVLNIVRSILMLGSSMSFVHFDTAVKALEHPDKYCGPYVYLDASVRAVTPHMTQIQLVWRDPVVPVCAHAQPLHVPGAPVHILDMAARRAGGTRLLRAGVSR